MRSTTRFLPALFVLAAVPAPMPPAIPRGFFPESAAAQQKVEREFRALPDPAVARESMRRLAAAPHHLGSPEGAKNAEWILARFKEWGLDARIETFDVLFPTPKERVLELIEPVKFRAALAETVLPEDPTSARRAAASDL
jgi:N-acetylated-alpha-linked acidic dipeptidase